MGTTFVLVHGAWGGSYGFRTVRGLLCEAGHEVYTPSLTGIGERAHLTSPQVDLTTHVGDRVAHLVYLDAFLPGDGDSLNDLAGASYSGGPVGPGAEWLAPPPGRSFDDPGEAAWQAVRRVPHPARCFSERVRLPKPLEDYSFSRTYIKALDDPRPAQGAPPRAFWAVADRVRNDPAWRYREIDTNHMIPANRPLELADLLLELP